MKVFLRTGRWLVYAVGRRCRLLLASVILIASASVSAQGWLGLELSPVPGNTARAHHLAPGAGAHIVRVLTGGPAERAGLRSGDIVLRLDGYEVRGPAGVKQIAERLKPGRYVPVVIMRYGNLMEIYVSPTPE
ncbi:MAG: PDZ domain-containing protein [Acidiferrobacterales bacterium]